jgi:acyl-CoA dehydrogenase
VLEDVFVPDAAIGGRRTPGKWHPLFQIIAMLAIPLIYAAYLGVAESAGDRALALARKRRPTPHLYDLIGELQNEVCAAELAHADMVAAAATDEPGFPTSNRVFTGRALVARSVLRAVDVALDVAGGAGFFRDAGLERLFRDAQSARFHQLQDGDQRHLAAALALGADPEAVPA